jgi:two-component system chemotaxis response regulator CheY
MNELKVLAVDDSLVHLGLLEHTLGREFEVVLTARNGREALAIFERERPAMVITDCLMPEVGGFELCQRIRAAQASYVYIIMVTSIAEKDNVVKGLTSGADDYLTKPFHVDELLARVQVGLRLLGLQRQLEEKNRILEHFALTDPLTGLPNRRAIEAWASHELPAAVRHGFPFWVVLIDLDLFKRVNDTYGHDAGDSVLKAFAEILRSNTRSSDISGRIGGEEFLHVITHSGEQHVPQIVERARLRLSNTVFVFDGTQVRVTASFGVAGFQRSDATPAFGDLISRADRALYRAKENGRNRVEFDLFPD